MSEFFGNRVFQATSVAWVAAQALKFFLELVLRHRFNLRLLTTMGGMPSSHSAAVSALTTAIAIREGVNSSVFVLSLIFATVTMYDAAGVRRAASIQARILNQMIGELFQGHPISETKLRELLGHTPIEVFVGLLLGITIAWWWMIR